MKYNIFISYARKDYQEVYAIYKMLKSEIKGINIWFDIDGIESGDEFDDKIVKAIDNSEILLFALSDNAIDSRWAKNEVMYAVNTHKRIIPVLLKGAQLKGWFLFNLGRIDCINLDDKLQRDKMIGNFRKWFGLKAGNAEKETVEYVNQEHKEAPRKDSRNLKITLRLVDAGQAKLAMVKTVKEIMGWDLRKSLDFVNSVPAVLPKTFTYEEMLSVKLSVEENGGKVVVQSVQH